MMAIGLLPHASRLHPWARDLPRKELSQAEATLRGQLCLGEAESAAAEWAQSPREDRGPLEAIPSHQKTPQREFLDAIGC